MIILISGLPGAGKSSVAKAIAKQLKYRHFSTGDLQRQLAKERKLTITQWGILEAKDPQYDQMVDDRVKSLVSTGDNIVMDSWIAPNFAKDNAVKLFLDCEENERARRRLEQKRSTEKFKTFDDTIADMRERIKTNRDRWMIYYNYDFMDMANYNLIIDTTNLKVEEVVAKILEFIRDFS
jgi:predicted cytidylate kinase